MTDTTSNVTAPSKALMLMEGRLGAEMVGFALTAPIIMARGARGDGHPVLILPGLATSDKETRPLRTILRALGHNTHKWELGKNLGPANGVKEALQKRIEDLYATYGQKVSLVGWSLGGVFARQLSKEMPEKIRCVVTLGTPFKGGPKETNAWQIFEFMTGESIETADPGHMGHPLETPTPVPTTSIYSKTDGICAWENCIQEETDLHQNVEVQSSHLGLVCNPNAVMAVAHTLAQPEEMIFKAIE